MGFWRRERVILLEKGGHTMNEWWQITLAIFGGVLVVLNVWTNIEMRIKALKAPSESLEERITLIEHKLLDYDSKLARDKARLDSIEEGNKVTQKALLALLSHAIDGDNIKELKEAKDELQAYLINR